MLRTYAYVHNKKGVFLQTEHENEIIKQDVSKGHSIRPRHMLLNGHGLKYHWPGLCPFNIIPTRLFWASKTKGAHFAPPPQQKPC